MRGRTERWGDYRRISPRSAMGTLVHAVPLPVAARGSLTSLPEIQPNDPSTAFPLPGFRNRLEGGVL